METPGVEDDYDVDDGEETPGVADIEEEEDEHNEAAVDGDIPGVEVNTLGVNTNDVDTPGVNTEEEAGSMSDDETEGFENSPRIMFNNGIKDSGISYYIPAQNGLASENQVNIYNRLPNSHSARFYAIPECNANRKT